MNSPLSPFVPENLVLRERFGRPVPRQPAHSSCVCVCMLLSPLILHSQAESSIINLVLSVTASIHTANRHHRYSIIDRVNSQVPSLSGRLVAYRWSSLPRVRQRRASSAEGSSSNGCCLLRKPDEPFFVRSSFPTPTIRAIIGKVDICDTDGRL